MTDIYGDYLGDVDRLAARIGQVSPPDGTTALSATLRRQGVENGRALRAGAFRLLARRLFGRRARTAPLAMRPAQR